MDQQEINVADIQVIEGFLHALCDVFRLVEGVPELGSYKDLFTRNTTVADCLANLLFVKV